MSGNFRQRTLPVIGIVIGVLITTAGFAAGGKEAGMFGVVGAGMVLAGFLAVMRAR